MSDSEIEHVGGGPFWVVLVGVCALGALALQFYQAGQKDGQCHG